MKDKKLVITMYSSASAVAGQGVGSAYQEQVRLVAENCRDLFEVHVNKWMDSADIQHFHTLDPQFFLKLKNKNAVNIVYCHFLPDTLEGSLKIPKLLTGPASSYIVSFYKAADRVVVVNPCFIDALAEYGIDRNKIYYIPNYVSKEMFHPTGLEDRNAWRKKYNIDPEAFVVLGCGQVQTRKGVKDFVATAKSLPHIHFVWAGGFSFGNMTDGYEELKEIMENPPENVTFTGIVDRSDMVHVFNMSDILFMPSYAELFPMTILEAVNLSKPLVLRDLELYQDILFDDYLKGKDNKEFKELIESLQKDPDLYARWVKKSEDLARFYSKENVLKMWREFYQDAYQTKFGSGGAHEAE